MIGERQTIWDWRIATYLAFAGIGGGAYVLGVASDIAEFGPEGFAKIGVTLGPIMVALGTLFLIWDLGKPMRFMYAGMRPHSSWISRGVFILTTFIVLGFIHFGFWVWPFTVLEDSEGARQTLAVIGGILGVLTITYTGLLLGAAKGIPFWSTPVLPLLFLVSGLSTGLLGIDLVSAIRHAIQSETPAAMTTPLGLDSALIAAEGVIVLMYLYMSYVTHPASKVSAESLLKGALAAPFWGGVVVLGLVIPLVVETVYLNSYTDAARSTQILLSLLAAIPGLVGGFTLRYIVIAAAVKTPLMVMGRPAPVRGGVRFRVQL